MPPRLCAGLPGHPCGTVLASGTRCRRCATLYRSGFSRHGWATAVKARDGGRCVRCGSRDRCVADHIIPLAHGGASTEENGQTLCHTCHGDKHRIKKGPWG